MQAAYYEQTGLAEQVFRLVALAHPVAGPGELRVRRRGSRVYPSDVKSRAGFAPGPCVWVWHAGGGRPDGRVAQSVVFLQHMAIESLQVLVASGAGHSGGRDPMERPARPARPTRPARSRAGAGVV